MINEMTLIMLREVPYIPANLVVTVHYWWPWIRNYYGERVLDDSGTPGIFLAHTWLDQAMKTDMGY